MSLLPLRLNLLDYISHYGYNLIMNYLFLDMECSNGNDICSFGYVLADENFNVLQQNDVLINPESKFVLTNRAGTQGISLAYDKDEFYAAPKFPDRYEFVKSLVENPENFVVGFAVSNDAGFIRRACMRYSLPQLSFKFFDTQRLDAAIHNEGNIRSLQKVIDLYGIEQDEENILHKSDDDAFFTLEILQKMLEEIGMSLPEAIKAYPQCCGETADGNITFEGHSISNIDKMRKKDVIVFRMNCAELKNRYAGTKGVLSGKKISFERAFESKNYRKMIVLAEKIYSLGGRLCSSHDCDLFVCTNAESTQAERAKQCGASLVSLPEFLSLTGMTEEELSAAVEKTDIKALKQKADLL